MMNDNSPEYFIQAMRQALLIGDFLKARQLSIQEIEHFPDREYIQNCVNILKPARATSVKRPIDKGLQKSREWVRQQRRNRNYLNQWVAVRDGELLATGSSLDELVEQIGDLNDVFVTVIY